MKKLRKLNFKFYSILQVYTRLI